MPIIAIANQQGGAVCLIDNIYFPLVVRKNCCLIKIGHGYSFDIIVKSWWVCHRGNPIGGRAGMVLYRR
jgi:hypothetical protein